MNVYLPYTRLPSEYQEVEYIENNGATVASYQYIDTGINATANIKIELEITPNLSYISENAILGTDWTAESIFLMFYSSKYRLHYGGNYGDASTTITASKQDVVISNTGITINGETTSISGGSSYRGTGSILLFAVRGFAANPSRYKPAVFKCNGMKMYDGSSLIRDLVPCYRKSDNVIGMYDLVNDQFYTNSGSGTFTKGADVYTNVLQNAYIGEYGYLPGIYHNTTLGLISLGSDGSNWLTIADKNLGASNIGDIGGIFQRGNNYQFSTSLSRLSYGQVNTDGYGPGNYYSGMWFRQGDMDWSNPSNLDLRGDTTDTLVARQGPCDSGYHVASATEWNLLLTILGTWSLASTGQYLNSYLKMPYGGRLNNSTHAYEYNGQYGFYWSSSSNTSDGTKGGFLQFSASTINNNLTSGGWKTMGVNIRPFKNEVVRPTEDWTILYQPN